MNQITQSCCKNNQGVALLLAGDTQGAFRAFKVALTAVKDLLDEIDQTSSASTSTLDTDWSSLVHASQLSSLHENQQLYVFDRPLQLRPPETESLDDHLLAFFASVILFNLALASHISGKDQTSATLYDMCMLAVADCLDFGALQHVLLVLALNNKAQLYFERCDYEKSATCLAQLSELLEEDMLLLHETMDEVEVEGIFLNSMLVHLPVPVAAKAA
jgi:hypothetical protein